MGADIERTSAHTCDTMSLALASGMGKGSSRDSARAMARGVGSLISMTVTNGLPLQWGGGKGQVTTAAKISAAKGHVCAPENGGHGIFSVAAAVLAHDCDQGAGAGLSERVERPPQLLGVP